MASPRAVILSVLAVALICSVFSVIDAKVCGGDADCLAPNAVATCVSGTCKYPVPRQLHGLRPQHGQRVREGHHDGRALLRRMRPTLPCPLQCHRHLRSWQVCHHLRC